MKKSVSIALTILVLLNAMGYYLVFMAIEYNNDVRMTRKMDAPDFKPSSAITVKIPIAIPYLPDDTEYARVDGKYEYKGEYYRMVKQKYMHDTLYIVCVKDVENKRIHGAFSDYVKGLAGKPSDQHNNAKLILTFNKDYIQHHLEVGTSNKGWEIDAEQGSVYNNLIDTYSPTIIHPPERG